MITEVKMLLSHILLIVTRMRLSRDELTNYRKTATTAKDSGWQRELLVLVRRYRVSTMNCTLVNLVSKII